MGSYKAITSKVISRDIIATNMSFTKTVFILIIILSSFYAFSQGNAKTLPWKDLKRDFSILIGYNVWNNHFAEIGLAVNQYGYTQVDNIKSRSFHHEPAWAYYVANEIKIDKKTLIGPKIGGWFIKNQGFTGLGMNLIYYTDFNNSSLRIRPEVGLLSGALKVVYGYNFAPTNKDFKGINRSNISIVWLQKVKRIKTITQ